MKNTKNNYIILIAMIIIIITLSIGFAAFSDKLNIKSSATLNLNEKDFKVLFSKSENKQEEGIVTAVGDDASTAAPIRINNNDNLKIIGLTAGFYASGNKVEYIVYIHNIGKYVAYLKSITYENYESSSNNKICIPLEGTTKSLVDDSCKYIKVKFKIDDEVYDETNNIENIMLDINEYKKMIITIEYEKNNINLNGDFIVKFGDIEFNYSSLN